MINFLYCFDENYNLQALISLNSLLNNINEEINVIFLHKDPKSIKNNKFLADIQNHKYLKEIEIIKFNKENISFPNLEKSHVSEATYYRLFISEHIGDYDNLVYLDPDILCLNNPIPDIKEKISLLEKSNFTVAAYTETNKNLKNEEEFSRLKVTGLELFNAGFLIIDFKDWRNKGLGDKLVNRLSEIFNEIVYWDQDVMNSFFNSNYLKLDKKFNYMLSYEVLEMSDIKLKELEDNALFIHYSGKFKPWTVKGTLNKSSIPYHDSYFQLTGNYYHIQNNWKPQALKDLIFSFKSLRIFNLKRPIFFIIYILKFLLKPR